MAPVPSFPASFCLSLTLSANQEPPCRLFLSVSVPEHGGKDSLSVPPATQLPVTSPPENKPTPNFPAADALSFS